MTDLRGKVINNETIIRGRRIINTLSFIEDHAVDFIDNDDFYKALNAKVNVDKVEASKGRHGFISDYLYRKLLNSPEAARRNVHHTTQQGIMTIMHPSLSRTFKTNDRVLRYNRLQHSVFTYIVQAGNFSRRGKRYAQVYSTESVW